MFSQIQYQNDQLMMMQAFQMQQQAYLYSSLMLQQPQSSFESKLDKKRNKRSYIQCELWKRQALIEKVDKDGLTIKDAAKILDVNYSTAKHIMKVYRQTGEVETKIMMKKKNRDCKSSNELDEDCEMNADNQYPCGDMQVQASSYDISYGQCQLPIDVNMVNPCFNHEPMSNEEKQCLQTFFFGRESSNQ